MSHTKYATHTQCRTILGHLLFDSITPADAISKYSIYRLAACICRLKKEPFRVMIEKQMESSVNQRTGKVCRYACYFIPDAQLIDAHLIYQQPFFRGQIVRHKTLKSSRILKVKSIIFDSAINKTKFKAFGTSQVFFM
jgi:hypothetical protein